MKLAYLQGGLGGEGQSPICIVGQGAGGGGFGGERLHHP